MASISGDGLQHSRYCCDSALSTAARNRPLHSVKKIESSIARLEQKTLETLDHTLATSVPLQLAKEINSCALEEAVVMGKQQ